MKKILIANRGEIAIRIIRACQELGLETVAIHSIVDKNSLHTKLADESVCIGQNPSLQSYLNIPKVMSAAEITGADAIHPGYGFLSESSEFAKVCQEYGLVFIGPSPRQIEILGNKVEARKLAISANIPLLPGLTEPIVDLKQAKISAEEIGYPVIIKASAGGGGRGMKIVNTPGELNKQLLIAQSEAKSCFGLSDCYLEKYLSNPRHIEIQIIADHHNNVLHLGERECSIQRRHQKIIEESPSITLDQNLKNIVANYAVSLARQAEYRSLGTVEFLFQDNRFYFMEMNTRVQVEHPVTESVTGIDLIKEQIQIAKGLPLSFKQEDVTFTGHSIECRINAEDPFSFAPCPGKVKEYHQPGGPGIRVDSMLYSGYTVPPHYDSMIAKLISYGKTRKESIQRMLRALKEMKISGIKNNSEFHKRILNDSNFQNNNLSTKFIENFLSKENIS
ncbi:MAG: acetyl-CoA carboxylase biotin carboxylase subunit [Zetaproteobacteria bacterium]|nr:acetyl-CoA carboxylase biotin carboxylase subunit [Pseudobdellovibrionaceae bacterium]